MSDNIYLNIYLEDIKKILNRSLSVQFENNQLLKEQNELLKKQNKFLEQMIYFSDGE